jgi:hypothetical protein
MMDESQPQSDASTLERAIALAEAARDACDKGGFIYAAIDISSALDKLLILKQAQTPP